MFISHFQMKTDALPFRKGEVPRPIGAEGIIQILCKHEQSKIRISFC